MATVVSVIASIVGLCTIRLLFTLLGAASAMLPLTTDYMVMWYLGFFSLLVPMAGAGVIRGTGGARLTRIWISESVTFVTFAALSVGQRDGGV